MNGRKRNGENKFFSEKNNMWVWIEGIKERTVAVHGKPNNNYRVSLLYNHRKCLVSQDYLNRENREEVTVLGVQPIIYSMSYSQ